LLSVSAFQSGLTLPLIPFLSGPQGENTMTDVNALLQDKISKDLQFVLSCLGEVLQELGQKLGSRHHSLARSLRRCASGASGVG
jgi:hypothetical protein